jgi:hypothetical protein
MVNNGARVVGNGFCSESRTFNDNNPSEVAEVGAWAVELQSDWTRHDANGKPKPPRIVAWRPVGFATHLVGHP